MKLSNLHEANWGWAVKGEDRPENIKAPRKSRNRTADDLKRMTKLYNWAQYSTVADDLLEKQRIANQNRMLAKMAEEDPEFDSRETAFTFFKE